MKTTYFTKDMNGDIIAIEHGSNQYMTTKVTSQEEADTLNGMQGITRAQAEAAMTASMFDSWDNFEKIVESIEEARR
jgi:hypothetical protein